MKPRKLGRKPLPRLQRKHPRAFRIRAGLLAKLEQAARRSVRTLGQEIEYRLVRSFRRTP